MTPARGEPTRVVLCVQNLSVPRDPRVWREARALRDAGYAVTVVGPGAETLARRERVDGIDLHRWRTPALRRGLAGQLLETVVALGATARSLRELRRSGPITVLHAANPPDTFFLLGRALRRRGTRFVYDQHDLCPELLSARTGPHRRSPRVLGAILRVLERRSYATADLVVAPNNSYRRVALERGRCDPDAVVVVRTGPDRVLPPAPAPDVPVVVFAGAINRQDRVDVLVDAAAIVLARRPGALRVVVVGSGDAVPALRARARRLGIDGAVTWTGWLDGEHFTGALRGASVGVSLDADDEFSRRSTMLKISDYLAAGLPCVVADLPENRVTAGPAAAYFPAGDAEHLARRLTEIVDDPARLDRLRTAAVARAPALRFEHSARRLVAAYRWLLDGGPPVPGDQHVDGAVTTDPAPGLAVVR